jgi:hypothetical protein
MVMKIRFSLRLLNAILITLASESFLFAQPLPGALGQPSRPAFSPYLNLNRPGGSPALNYFGLVQPQTQFRQNFQNLQGAVNSNQQMIGNLQGDMNGGLPATGHGFGFMNYSGYFMNTGQTNTNQNQMFSQNRFNSGQMFRTPSPGVTGPTPGSSYGGVGRDVRRR